jgi:hypothetical protein
MIMKTMKAVTGIIGIFLIVSLLSCSSEETSPAMGEVVVNVTDAPINPENIEGVFLSISEVHAVMGEEMDGMDEDESEEMEDGEDMDEGEDSHDNKVIVTFEEPVFFDLMSYQNGATYLLGNGLIEAGTYKGLRFIISGKNDSYVLMKDGTQEPLNIPSGTKSGYKVNGAFEVGANSTTAIVADIDLSKALIMTGQGNYKLRPTGRVITQAVSGTITGTVTGTLNENEIMMVYAYEAGTYTEAEADTPAEGETRFQNAVNSAVVAEDGSYTLAFMPPGEYEIVVATYSSDENMDFIESITNTLLLDGEGISTVTVTANATVTVSIIL